MADIGEIKAKVTIEYDGSGIEQAKKDLASLADAAGSVGEGASGAEDALGSLDEQAVKSAENVGSLRSAFADLPKLMENSGDAVASFGGALSESQDSLDKVGESVQSLNEPLAETRSILEATTPQMVSVAKQAEEVSKQFDAVGESLQSIVEPLGSTQSFTDLFNSLPPPGTFLSDTSVSDIHAQFGQAFGLLNDTGESFVQMGTKAQQGINVISDSVQGGTSSLEDLSKSADTSFSSISNGAAAADKSVSSFVGSSSVSSMNDIMTRYANGINAFGGVGADQYAPLTPLEATAGKPIGFGEAFGNTTEGIMGALNDVAMPLMAVQMIGMAVGQVGKSIYDMAATAEGPGAHGIGSFTGTVDALGQSLAGVGQQFSEGFGQGVLPTLQQLNDQASQQGGAGGLGAELGAAGSFLFNIARIGTGIDIQGGWEGLQNQWAQFTGQPLPNQGPGPQSQAAIYTTQQMNALPQTVAMQTAQAKVQASTLYADVTNPDYLQAQDQLTAAQKYAQHIQDSYDISHPISYADFVQQQQQQSLQLRTQQAMANQQTYGQSGDFAGAFAPIGNFFGGFGNVLGGVGSGIGAVQGGIGFIQGIANLLGNPLGTLGGMALGGLGDLFGNIGGGIGGFFGNLFSGGGLSPNAGVGAGLGASIGGAQNMANNGTGNQQVQLNHTFTANVTWEANNLSKSFTAVANWAEQGVTHAVTAVANWVDQNVIHPVVAAAQWAEQNVEHAVTAVANWAEQNVEHSVVAAAQWAEKDLIHPAVAAAQWAEKDLEHLFTGIASWVGEGLEHTFNAIANWTAQNLNPSFQVNPSVSMLADGTSNWQGGPAIVGEAGTEVVAHNGQYSIFDQGATLLDLPAGASVYPMQRLASSSGATQFADGIGNEVIPITFGMKGGNAAPSSISVIVNLDTQSMISALGLPLASTIRLSTGMR